MKLVISTPAKALNKAYLRQSLKREQIETFRENLVTMFGRLKPGESEEHLKNILADFLKDTWYKQTNEINTSGRADLVIHNGRSSGDPVGVIIEVKRPDNTTEMISPEKPNAKALHELLLYYLTERYLNNNKEIKRLIVCNIYDWYIFDAADFERFFFDNPKLVKGFKEWKDGLFGIDKTEWFYREIARPLIEKELTELPCAYFDLRDYVTTPALSGTPSLIRRGTGGGDDRKLIALYKLLSPPHLLKLPFANDSNTLNREFYNELLHIIGLEEVREKGKKLIRRKPEGKRNDGSLLENTINILTVRNKVSPSSSGDEAFDLALELCITWLNRILFLKLLEGQLRAYHRGNRQYVFLDTRHIADFDELEELFFEVLARRNIDRTGSVRERFGNIPYLNSALFDESDLERDTIHIAALKGRLDLELHGGTVLKDSSGKRLTGRKNTLQYLFEFLDAYDFSSEGEAEIHESARTIINASVLGLIFEKINGYKDGSFYTPGYITMYICRETIRRAVVERFRQSTLPGLQNLAGFDDLRDRLDCSDREVRKRANSVINSVTVCDPAVGSGHFLVSALNELIAIKSELGILSYRDNGDRVREYRIGVENDELIVIDKETDELFAYTLNRKDSPIDELQRLQETIFHEKQDIIENCLFGVDINPKSVAICRLRLWIELLKNAYYTRESGYTELETLPNIDINIKCGNSLVSRFAIYGNPDILPGERKKLKELTEKYRRHVFEYKLSPANKAHLREVIDNLKHELENFGLPNDKDLRALWKAKDELAQLSLFGFDKKEQERRQKLHEKVAELEQRFEEKQRLVYSNAFEWRFEFPEVMDESGEFTGFDVVITNPPYGNIIPKIQQAYYSTYYHHQDYQKDLYLLFLERFEQLLKKQSFLGIIIPNTWLQSITLRKIRKYMTNNYQWENLLHLPSNVFDAVVDTVVFVMKKSFTEKNRPPSVPIYVRKENIDLSHELFWKDIPKNGDPINIVADSKAQNIYRRLISDNVPLCEVCNIFNGVKPFEKGKGTPPQTDLILKNKPFVYEGSAPDNTWSPLLRGSLIQRYIILWDNNYWIKYGPWLAAPRDASIFEAPLKIMVRQTGDSIIATMVASGYIARNNLHILLPHDDNYDLHYILGLLNSKLMDFLYSVMNPEKGEALAEVKKQHVEQLPITKATAAQQAPVIGCVQKILAAKQADPQADISALEAEIDQLVYALYGLTEEDIALVEGKK
jgi:adenine-specific DNA-methyltransferase